jgi:hypothetical protein
MADKQDIINWSFEYVIKPLDLPIDELISYLLVGTVPTKEFNRIDIKDYCEYIMKGCRWVLCHQLSNVEIDTFKSIIDNTVKTIVSMGINYYLSNGLKIIKCDNPTKFKDFKITITGNTYHKPSIDYLISLGYQVQL